MHNAERSRRQGTRKGELRWRRLVTSLAFMADSGGELKADPAVLAATCEALSAASDHLLAQLKSLDGTVTSMLATWQGSSGGAYSDVWTKWHQGADEVEKGLATMAHLLGQAGKGFEEHEQATGENLRGVYGG
jgi:WXG100 family type VII secretion target